MRRISVERDGYGTALEAVTRSLPEDDSDLVTTVAAIVRDVRHRGDSALLELGRRFDAAELDRLAVSDAEWEAGFRAVDACVREALDEAYAAVRAFHEPQRRTTWLTMADGQVKGQVIRPLERVGLYVPGGLAAYPSSVIMGGVPAQVAGSPDIRLCTPATPDGSVLPSVLYAASLVGAKAVYRVGGAQAIAAMAYGTETIPRVDKIAGPGNAYVCAAKRMLWGVADMDMVAGPSEVCVVADSTARATYVAADMLSQAEHDPACAAYLITNDADLADRVEVELGRQARRLERRDVVERSFAVNGAIVVAGSLDECLDLANACAPEHLALMVADPMAALASVRHAGAVILGHMTPQTTGDYVAGPSHVLPTSGTARFWSPLNVDTFTRKMSLLCYDEAALRRGAAAMTRLATSEGFGAHAAAVTVRLADIGEGADDGTQRGGSTRHGT